MVSGQECWESLLTTVLHRFSATGGCGTGLDPQLMTPTGCVRDSAGGLTRGARRMDVCGWCFTRCVSNPNLQFGGDLWEVRWHARDRVHCREELDRALQHMLKRLP